ncbi:MAG TPA: AAA family ATPase [Candidatus Saccharimonadales bacterium]|nr:AAA family ATPase [Candidatus Saccharimonadales bacterium]
MRRGLVFGKFMPLHRGHELLINAALSQADDVTIVVYDSKPKGDYPPMPVSKRLKWLGELYPEASAIVAVYDPHGGQPDADDEKYAQEYANGLAFLGKFDLVFTSEPGYEKFAQALGARHVIVDAARELVPISGTKIREDVYMHRGWMDPRVYGTLIQKVVFVGTESTGKSTLAKRMAEELDTVWTHEYGRELWTAQGGGTFHDHLPMAHRQYAREQAAMHQAHGFVFCDTNAWTTLQWSLMAYNAADGRLIDLVEKTKDEYVWILCAPDFGWVDDGIRELHGRKALDFHEEQIKDLDKRGIKYYQVSGSVEERVEQVKKIIKA